MAAINPYINFNGNCEAAFNLYKSVFGNDFITFSRFKDMPSENQQTDEAEKILHVALPIGEGTILMGSDCPAAYGAMKFGDNISISINTHSEEEANKIFHALAEGGKVTMPLDKTFWGAYFGMLTDAFGINWMVNYDYQEAK